MTVSLEDKRKKFPLKVCYPGGGTKYLLVVYNYNEGHHIWMANSEETLKFLLAARLKRSNWEPQSMWRAEIVAPPRWLVDKYAETKFENAVWYFRMNLCYKLREMNPLPAGVERCENYDPDRKEYTYSDEEDDSNPYFHDPRLEKVDPDDEYSDVAMHRACTRCGGDRFLIPGRTWEDLYLKHGDTVHQFEISHNRYFPQPEKTFVSTAPESDPRRFLWVVVADHGHHMSGNKVLPVSDFGNGFGSVTPLFFFHGENIALPQWVDDMIKQDKLDTKKAREEEKAANEQERREYEAAERAMIERILSDE